MRRPPGRPGHADLRQRGGHPRLHLALGQAEVARAEGDVLADGGHEQLVVGVLEDDADPPPDLLQVPLGDRQPGDLHAAAPAAQDAVEVQHQGGLAGAVGPEQRDPLAALDAQVDAVERLVSVGVGEREVLDEQGGGGHPSSRPDARTAAAPRGRARAVSHAWRGTAADGAPGIRPV